MEVFQQLDQQHIQYCVLRGYEELDLLDDTGDVDLLVRDDQIGQFQALMAQLHFVRLPSWGHAPHQFYVAYDESSDRWLKLDAVTTVMFGKPIPALKTLLAEGCLARRQRRGPTYVPSPEDELVTTLLHCLLDKGAFSAHRLARIKALRAEITDEAYLNKLLRAAWAPDLSWALAALIDTESWPALAARCTPDRPAPGRGQRLAVCGRTLAGRALRKLDRIAGVLQPRALTVALLAPDGGGKTTLATELARRFFLPSRYIYMGTNPTPAQLACQPPAGSRHAHSVLQPIRLLARGLRFPNNVAEQWYRYGVSYYHMVRGRLVLFDRYVYDAPAAQRRTSLKSRLRRWMLAAIAPKPDLVVFLDAPGEVLYARKGEHSPSILEQQRQHYLGLQQHLPQMVVVDATNNADQVRRTVTSLIWQWYAKHLRGDRSAHPREA
ncbi:MAG: hypothetical protein U0Z44_06630 [Kouleothrix sp.]